MTWSYLLWSLQMLAAMKNSFSPRLPLVGTRGSFYHNICHIWDSTVLSPGRPFLGMENLMQRLEYGLASFQVPVYVFPAAFKMWIVNRRKGTMGSPLSYWPIICTLFQSTLQVDCIRQIKQFFYTSFWSSFIMIY